MTDLSRRPPALPEREAPASFTRRRFLSGIGVLAGAGVLAPLAARFRGEPLARLDVTRVQLGTPVRIVVRHEDERLAERAVERAFAAIARVDRQMSIHRPDSQLARVNAAAGERAVSVDADVLEVVERAVATSRRSGGVYDPTVLPLMRLYGFYASGRTAYPSDREIAATLARVGAHQVVADPAAGTLALATRGAALDLGSIGKGWAVDRAVAALRAEGVTSAMVDVGRNVYGLGAPETGAAGWSVGALHPVTGAVDRVFVLRDTAVATSGNHERAVDLGGVRVGHLLDARLGRPAVGHLSASVQARSATDADAGSTAAFLLGPAHADRLPEHLAVHVIG
jgi:thiamine biosynthesis lipoprotein